MDDALFDARVGKARVTFKYSNEPEQRINDLCEAVGLLTEALRAAVAMLKSAEKYETESMEKTS